jgi:hypothetical protein
MPYLYYMIYSEVRVVAETTRRSIVTHKDTHNGAAWLVTLALSAGIIRE